MLRGAGEQQLAYAAAASNLSRRHRGSSERGDGLFDAAFAHGKRIGMVGTFGPSMASMRAEFDEVARAAAPGAVLRDVLADAAAREALNAGDAARHNELVAAAAAGLRDIDAIMLAHFSTARALAATRARVAVPVLTAPDAAVAKLRSLVQ